jgi:hypothetical protein
MRVALRTLVVASVLAAGPALAGHVAVAREAQNPPPEVEVLGEGKAPREALRLVPAIGTSERATMTMTFRVEQSGESSARIEPPPIRFTIATTVQGVTPEGRLQLAVSYPAVDVLRGGKASTRERRALEDGLRGLTGVSSQLTMTAQGAIVDSSLNVPSDLDPSIQEILSQLGDQLGALAVPFPESPVGIGARWRATTTLSVSGIEARQVYEVTLKKRTGGKLELGVLGTQTAEPQVVELPDVAPGVELRLTRFRTTLRGENTVDLASPLPIASQLRGSSKQTFRVEAGDDSGTVRQHIDIRMTLKPAKR